MIIINNLKKIFKEKLILNNVDFQFSDKGLYLIGGESGIGKTTFLNMVSGLDLSYDGNIEYNGNKYTKNSINEIRRLYFGYIFQEIHLIPELNVYDNIAMSLHVKNEKVKKDKILETLKIVKLDGFENKKVNKLSGGEKQRVAIARALVKSPKVIFADEPIGMLDKNNSLIIYDILKEISKNILVVMVSHDIDNALPFSNYYLTIKDYQIVSKEINPIIENDIQSSKFNKNPFSFVFYLKLGLNYIKLKPIKFIFSILLVAFSLVMFGTSFSISNYNSLVYEERILNGIGYDSFVIYKSEKKNDKITYQTTITKSEVESININNNAKFQGVISNSDNKKYFINYPDYHKIYNNMISEYISGVTYVSSELIDSNNYELYGRLPLNDDEIVITDYFYQSFKEYGYYDQANNIIIECPSKDDILNNEFSLHLNGTFGDEKKYKICGILDTNFDYARYEVLKDYNTNDTYDDSIMDSIRSYKSCSFHSLGFISKESFMKENTNYDYIIDAMPSNEKEIQSLLKYFQNISNENLIYNTINPTDTWFENVNSVANITKNLCLIAGFILLAFSIILMFTLFNSLIANKIKDIGILMAFGSKKTLISCVFLVEACLICLIGLITATCVIPFVLNALSYQIAPSYYSISKIFQFGLVDFSILLIVEIIMSFIAIVLPIIKLSRKNPVDILSSIS